MTARMHHFDRTDAPKAAIYGMNGHLPQRGTFDGHAEILAAYDEFVSLKATLRHHEDQSVAKRAASTQAEITYKGEVLEAMKAGTDAAKVKNRAPQLLAEAEGHSALAADAKLATLDAGRQLGALVQEHGREFYAAAEDRMDAAVRVIAENVDALRAAFGEWSAAWGVRDHLSRMVNSGGTWSGQLANGLSPAVTQALAELSRPADILGRLKADESTLGAWRDQESAAREHIAKYTHQV